MLHDRLNRPVSFCSIGTRAWWFIPALLALLDTPGAEVPVPNLRRPDPTNLLATNLNLKQTSPGTFELDGIQLDKHEQSVSFRALVNMKQGNLEYLLVTTTGKTHESLLRTEAKPLQIQLALLLLGGRGTTNALPQDPAKSLPGDKVTIELSWTVKGRVERFPAEQFVTDVKVGGPMSRGHWIYNGSRLREDGFAAQMDGSIVSLITDPDALINNPRPGRENDDNWLPRANDLPPLNSPVEVTIRLEAQGVK